MNAKVPPASTQPHGDCGIDDLSLRRAMAVASAKTAEALPRVDVVIPALNAAAFIRHAIDSALDQSGVEVQVFVVDAGSTDETTAVVGQLTDPRVHLVDGGGRLNASQARNRGVPLGDAPWISYLDADDMWPQQRTSTLLAALTDPTRQIAYGQVLTFADGVAVDTRAVDLPVDAPSVPTVGASVFARSLHERVGRLDESLRMGEFIDWMSRARQLGCEDVPVAVVALLRRAHAHNTTRNVATGARDYLRVVAAHLARRRDAAINPEQ